MTVRTTAPPWTITLRHRRPDGTSELVRRTGPRLEIGSDRDADLVLAGPGVAPRHCRLVERRGVLCLLDRGAPGGTAVDFCRITEPTPLAAGHKICLGDHVLEVLSIRRALALAQLVAGLRRGPVLFGATTLSRPRPDVLARPQRRRLALPFALLGSLLGTTLAAALPGPATDPATCPAALVPAARPVPEVPRSAPAIEHTVIPGETLAEIASLYDVDPRALARWNALSPTAAPTPGQRLRVHTSRPPLHRELVRHRVRAGESWDTLARRFGVDPARLRARNRHCGDSLRPGDIVDVWAPRIAPLPSHAPAAPIVPPDAASAGRPFDDGRLERGLQLPPHRDYDLRCPLNAHASSHTAAHLLTALARLRAGYRGQIVVGDLSRERGGAYGPHLSHQSGRDVDLWLPIAGGLYRTDPACARCGTPWCRPEPRDIDWPATWRLIASLESTGAVKQIFLDRAHFPALRRAARAAGLDDDALARAIQPRRGAPALVTHSAGHTRHLHVRFRCGPDEPSCVD